MPVLPYQQNPLAAIATALAGGYESFLGSQDRTLQRQANEQQLALQRDQEARAAEGNLRDNAERALRMLAWANTPEGYQATFQSPGGIDNFLQAGGKLDVATPGYTPSPVKAPALGRVPLADPDSVAPTYKIPERPAGLRTVKEYYGGNVPARYAGIADTPVYQAPALGWKGESLEEIDKQDLKDKMDLLTVFNTPNGYKVAQSLGADPLKKFGIDLSGITKPEELKTLSEIYGGKMPAKYAHLVNVPAIVARQVYGWGGESAADLAKADAKDQLQTNATVATPEGYAAAQGLSPEQQAALGISVLRKPAGARTVFDFYGGEQNTPQEYKAFGNETQTDAKTLYGWNGESLEAYNNRKAGDAINSGVTIAELMANPRIQAAANKSEALTKALIQRGAPTTVGADGKPAIAWNVHLAKESGFPGAPDYITLEDIRDGKYDKALTQRWARGGANGKPLTWAETEYADVILPEYANKEVKYGSDGYSLAPESSMLKSDQRGSALDDMNKLQNDMITAIQAGDEVKALALRGQIIRGKATWGEQYKDQVPRYNTMFDTEDTYSVENVQKYVQAVKQQQLDFAAKMKAAQASPDDTLSALKAAIAREIAKNPNGVDGLPKGLRDVWLGASAGALDPITSRAINAAMLDPSLIVLAGKVGQGKASTEDFQKQFLSVYTNYYQAAAAGLQLTSLVPGVTTGNPTKWSPVPVQAPKGNFFAGTIPGPDDTRLDTRTKAQKQARTLAVRQYINTINQNKNSKALTPEQLIAAVRGDAPTYGFYKAEKDWIQRETGLKIW